MPVRWQTRWNYYFQPFHILCQTITDSFYPQNQSQQNMAIHPQPIPFNLLDMVSSKARWTFELLSSKAAKIAFACPNTISLLTLSVLLPLHSVHTWIYLTVLSLIVSAKRKIAPSLSNLSCSPWLRSRDIYECVSLYVCLYLYEKT